MPGDYIKEGKQSLRTPSLRIPTRTKRTMSNDDLDDFALNGGCQCIWCLQRREVRRESRNQATLEDQGNTASEACPPMARGSLPNSLANLPEQGNTSSEDPACEVNS